MDISKELVTLMDQQNEDRLQLVNTHAQQLSDLQDKLNSIKNTEWNMDDEYWTMAFDGDIEEDSITSASELVRIKLSKEVFHTEAQCKEYWRLQQVLADFDAERKRINGDWKPNHNDNIPKWGFYGYNHGDKSLRSFDRGNIQVNNYPIKNYTCITELENWIDKQDNLTHKDVAKALGFIPMFED